MAMNIEFEYFVNKDGNIRCKVTEISGILPKNELPKSYTDKVGEPACYMENGVLVVKSGSENMPGWGTSVDTIKLGDTTTPENKDWIVKFMRASGGRLAKINKDIQALKKACEGKKEHYTI